MEELLKRYTIEPRGGGMYSYKCWLVLYDNESQNYIKEPGKKGYKRFKDSNEIIKWYEKEK